MCCRDLLPTGGRRLIRISMRCVQPVRRNPYPQVIVRSGAQYLRLSPVSSHQFVTDAQHDHAAWLAEALRYQSCSPQCANWRLARAASRSPEWHGPGRSRDTSSCVTGSGCRCIPLPGARLFSAATVEALPGREYLKPVGDGIYRVVLPTVVAARERVSPNQKFHLDHLAPGCYVILAENTVGNVSTSLDVSVAPRRWLRLTFRIPASSRPPVRSGSQRARSI